jgi:hypothetical protein
MKETIGREESLLDPVYRIERKQGKKELLQMKRNKMKKIAIPKILCTEESRLFKICHGLFSNAAFPTLTPNLSFILSFYPVYLFFYVFVWRFPNKILKNENAGFSVPNVIFDKIFIYLNDPLFNFLLIII